MVATTYRQQNPFTPMFGKVPAYMAGRELIIDDLLAAFEGNGADPNLCSVFTGARGTGKTALLTYLGCRAQQAGWITASTTAAPGMLEDIIQRLEEGAARLVPQDSTRRLRSVEVASLEAISWENEPKKPGNWRTRMNALLDVLAASDTGVLITVDELDATLDEMTQLVTVYQHFVRENRKVALLMAGLPYRVSMLLLGKSTSFLRRAARHDLGSIPPYEVKEAFRLTVEDGGKTVEDAALDAAAAAIDGFPFMFQLVGYRSWNAARQNDVITAEDVRQGVLIAQEELEARVFDATYSELSKGDRTFLGAMSPDGTPTSRADIAARLGKGSSYVSTYKKRLLETGVIEEVEAGVFKFALPGFGDYLARRKARLGSIG